MKRLLFASLLLKAKPRTTYYVGESDGGNDTVAGGAGNDTVAGGSGDDTVAGGGGSGGDGGKTGAEDDKPKFSQKAVNKMLADDRRKHEERVNKTVAQLEDLKKAKGLSDQEKGKLQTQIDELQASLLTKEEQAKKELEKKDKEYKKGLEGMTHDRDFWQSEYSNETTRNRILMSAATHEAVSAEQLMEILIPKTRLVEILGEDGKSQSPKRFIPKVKFKTKNEKGEEIELDLTIEESVKRMKDEPERFGNLFKSGLNGGLGGTGSAGGATVNGNKPPSDPGQYRIWRKANKITSRH